MSEPTSPSDPTPAVPPAPSFTYGTPAPAAPVAQPIPTYGEQVPGYSAPGAPVYGQMPVVKVRRTWDFVLTIILLVVGFFGMGIGVLYGIIFMNQQLLEQVLAQSGYGTPALDPTGPGAWIIASHLILYVITVALSIFLLVKKTIAFYVPLAAGFIAAIVFWVIAAQVFLSIPGFGR